LLDEALDSMSRNFDAVYAEGGRDSVAPERLMRAVPPQVLYSIRSEQLLCEPLEYNLLFRWFVGLSRPPANTPQGLARHARPDQAVAVLGKARMIPNPIIHRLRASRSCAGSPWKSHVGCDPGVADRPCHPDGACS
jgi:hypothetical protein